jgi:hypothetical protein
MILENKKGGTALMLFRFAGNRQVTMSKEKNEQSRPQRT